MAGNNKKKQLIVFGLDEVGRGCLAGPVMACAMHEVCPRTSLYEGRPLTLKDSKKLTEKQREEVFAFLKGSSQFVFSLGRVGERVIDKINIFEATKLAMERAVLGLEKKIGKKANLLLLDGNFKIPLKREQQAIVKGDEKIPLIALASIVAKVKRDSFMEKQDKNYPQYGFAKHKGYGTKEHLKAILINGPCPLHRHSFYPLRLN